MMLARRVAALAHLTRILSAPIAIGKNKKRNVYQQQAEAMRVFTQKKGINPELRLSRKEQFQSVLHEMAREALESLEEAGESSKGIGRVMEVQGQKLMKEFPDMEAL